MPPTIQQIQLADNDYAELKKFMANKEYMTFLKTETAFLPDTAITKQRFWHILNNCFEIKTCNCKNKTPLTWNIKNNTYRSFCSSKCAHNDNSVKLKTENTCMERYGVKTNLVTKEAKEHYADVMIEKFGVDNPFKSAVVQQGIKDYWFEEFGVTNPSQVEEIQDKITETHLLKYNRIRANQSHFSDESYELKYNKQALVELYNDVGLNIKEIAEKLNVGHSQLCIQFKNLGIEIHQNVGQQQVYNFIKSMYFDEIIFNDRKLLDGKEIDIFLPELNIGFEYDGIFWHSEDSSGKKNYHMEKDKLAKLKGIKLYHILDLEWNNKQDLVKSRISSFLGNNKTIYGRKTEIKILDKKLATKFFNDNHFYGSAGASFYVGLEYEGEIVAAMSFGKSRYNSYQFELIRFCSLQGHNVIGGASKLFKYSVEKLNADNVVSFCDLRWGTGKVYETLGFEHIRDNGPSYSYTHNYRTYESRIKYQKHKLEKILPVFDNNLSEWENMKNNKFDRYWDSGNGVYVWTR